MMQVQVVCLTSQKQIVIPCLVAENSTVREVILQSNIGEYFPDLNLQRQKVGIFNKIVPLWEIVSNKDRIEIYWPLQRIPKNLKREFWLRSTEEFSIKID
jgi:putative ubiquitin-RnfH superfamily antitoxin RatB of RatAB toxin-antitoxin module